MDSIDDLFSRRSRGMRGSDIRDAFRLVERRDMISLAGGFPDEKYFPLDQVRELVEELTARDGGLLYQYGPTEGLLPLRERVADSMNRLGVASAAEQVLLTGGSQQALDLIGRVFLDPGDVVLAECPGYVGGISAFAAYEARLVGVALDRQGLDPVDLECKLQRLAREGARVKLLYTVPCFQNPTGTCLSEERRRAVLKLAQQYGFLVVEDDPYREIYFNEAPPRPIAAGDSEGRVLYLGSFSKVFMPGLRVGWVRGPEKVISRLALAKQPADLCSNMFGQRLVEGYLSRGWLAPREERLREEYRRRCLALDAALKAEEVLTWIRPGGGFFLWAALPEGGDARKLQPVAAAEGVAYIPGAAFHVDGGGQRWLRLAYSQSDPERLAEAARRLGRAIRSSAEIMVDTPGLTG